MGAIASPWDNAITESLMSTIKAECTDINTYKSIKEATLDIFDYIEVFYKKHRFHSSLGMMSPMEFEEAYYQQMALAS
jgi:transposase InsO family protein